MADDSFIEKLFVFKFPTCTTNQDYTIEIPLKIPYRGNVKELTYRVMSSFKLPCYVETDLMNSLSETVEKWTQEYYDERDDKLIDAAVRGELDVERIVKDWERAYKTKTVEYAEPIGTTDEELFAAAYHRLVHSPSLEPILQAEHKYGKDVTEVIQIRDGEYEQLTQKLDFLHYITFYILILLRLGCFETITSVRSRFYKNAQNF